MKRIFIVPTNDGEGAEIAKILQINKEKFLITKQPWGASWEGLEKKIIDETNTYIETNLKRTIYGIELRGEKKWGNAINIDHHQYPEENRSHPSSSIEQVAKILNIPLTRHQRLISLNDTGWIPAMEKFGASSEEINHIRSYDRLCQGITAEDEKQAIKDIKSAIWKGRKVLVKCSKGATSAINDFLYKKYDEALIMDTLNNKWSYYGQRQHYFFTLFQKHNNYSCWAGGKASYGFTGVVGPSLKLQKMITLSFWRKNDL